VKRRFLQFSLRGLLGLAALPCFLLGSRHLLETYGPCMKVSDTSDGKARVQWRFVRFFGRPEYTFGATFISSSELESWTGVGSIHRSWLCCYEFDQRYDKEPGELIVVAGARDYGPRPEDLVQLSVDKGKGFKVTLMQSPRLP